MNMFARFDEIPTMNIQDIKETKRYGRTDGYTDGLTTWKQYSPFTKKGWEVKYVKMHYHLNLLVSYGRNYFNPYSMQYNVVILSCV